MCMKLNNILNSVPVLFCCRIRLVTDLLVKKYISLLNQWKKYFRCLIS